MRKHNFNAGPAALPLGVLEQAQRDLVTFPGAGMSLLEMSHRSKAFEAVLRSAGEALGALYGLPDTHEVLFLQGGASLQFAQVPLNLGPGGGYLTTGEWSQKALAEAKVIDSAHELWSGKEGRFRGTPPADQVFDGTRGPGALTYLHYCSNETIHGVQFQHVPQTPAPLVAALSSDFISRPMDLSRYALVYAGAQKNAGPAGVTVVIGRKDVLRGYAGSERTPKILRYATQANNESMYNTPPTFAIYLVGLVAKWALDEGGLEAIAARNARKARRLYDVIDGGGRFQGHAAPEARSHMNVTFTTGDEATDARFVAEAEKQGFVGLKGHRAVGGLRASIYNAVPEESVEALTALMSRFD